MLSLQHSTLNYNNYDSLQYSTPNYNNYDLHKQNKDRLSITEEASQESSKSVAETFSPDRVQKILVELGFGEDNVASWNEPIEVPFGVSSTLFIARVAIIYGLPFRHIDLYPELEGIYVHGGEIPKIVKDKIQSLSTEKIVGGKTRDEIPANIFAYEYKYRSNEQKINVISQIRDKFGDQKKFLYRGINSHSINLTLIEGFMDARHQGTLRKEFGVGLYTTPDIEYAVSYAGRNGSLLIFDWTDPDGNLMFKDLSNLKEWKATVKGYICVNDNNKPRPPQHREDIIEGPISSNYDSISRCSDPIPSETIQIVAKTDSGINAFASRLFAIIYLK